MRKILFAIVISVMIFPIVFAGKVSAAPLVHRIAGYTQYDTSAAIAKEGWTQSDYAVLAYGENFPDALAAAPLARKYNAPILLTETRSLSLVTKQTLQDLKVKNVFIAGGKAVVSETVENQLKDLGIGVTRLAGNDKYDTAIEIAEQIGAGQEIAVVTGDDYADALTISSVTALNNVPIILVPKNHLTDSIKNYLSSNSINHTYLIGSLEQISDSVANQFPNSERITGSDKYARNVAVLNRFDAGFDVSTIFLATGNGFADALAGSAYAAGKKAPILLMDSSYNAHTAGYLNSKNIAAKQLNVLGGEAVMPSAMIQKYINPSADTSQPAVTYKPSDIAKIVSPSVVHIEVSDSQGVPITNGSGFIVDSTGKIATNYHVIKGGYSAKVKTHDGKLYDVTKILGYNSTQDTALLKIQAAGLTPVALGDSDKIGTGDKIYTIGNPLGLDETMSDGLISTKSRVVEGTTYIQISAPISAGSSGGVLLNEQAEVIGITSAGITEGQNLNFAVPINLLKPMLTQDNNLAFIQLPQQSIPTEDSTKLTDKLFEDFLNSEYQAMTIAGKTTRFTWKVNDYQTGSSKVSIHGMINSKDFGNWIDLVTNHKGEVMLYFAQLNNKIALNYPGDSFTGSVLYEDYYSYLPSPQFEYNEISYSSTTKWFVSHIVVSFYDLYTMGKSDSRVVISD